MEVVFLALLLLLFAAVLWWVARRSRQLYERALGALDSGRVVSFGPFPRRAEGTWHSRRVRIWKVEGSQNSPSRMGIRLSGTPVLNLHLTPEGSGTRFLKHIGLGGLDVQVGDRDLDNAFLIRSDDAEGARRLLRSPGPRGAVLHLQAQGIHHIQLSREGGSLTKIPYKKEDFDPSVLRGRLESLSRIVAGGEGSVSPGADLATTAPPVPALDLPEPAVGAAPVPPMPGEEAQAPLQPAGGGRSALFLAALVAAAVALLLYFLL